jgi:hypothetical protein
MKGGKTTAATIASAEVDEVLERSAVGLSRVRHGRPPCRAFKRKTRGGDRM